MGAHRFWKNSPVHSTGCRFAWPSETEREVLCVSAPLRFILAPVSVATFQPQNAPVNAVTRDFDIEVDEQIHFPTTQPQVGKQLRVMKSTRVPSIPIGDLCLENPLQV